jgi:hypothetical protein
MPLVQTAPVWAEGFDPTRAYGVSVDGGVRPSASIRRCRGREGSTVPSILEAFEAETLMPQSSRQSGKGRSILASMDGGGESMAWVRKRDRYTRLRAKRSRPTTPAPMTGWLISELSHMTQVSVRTLRKLRHRGPAHTDRVSRQRASFGTCANVQAEKITVERDLTSGRITGVTVGSSPKETLSYNSFGELQAQTSTPFRVDYEWLTAPQVVRDTQVASSVAMNRSVDRQRRRLTIPTTTQIACGRCRRLERRTSTSTDTMTTGSRLRQEQLRHG